MNIKFNTIRAKIDFKLRSSIKDLEFLIEKSNFAADIEMIESIKEDLEYIQNNLDKKE